MGDQVWLYLDKDRLQGSAKKLKPFRYGPFHIVEQMNENAFRLDLPAYMNIYSITNVKNLKLFEPSMLTEEEQEGNQVLPSIEDLVPHTMNALQEDSVLQKKVCTTRRGQQELWLTELKGQKPNKAKWYDITRVGELFPRLNPK